MLVFSNQAVQLLIILVFIIVDPMDKETALNSNNSTSLTGGGLTLYGANDRYSFDGGEPWEDFTVSDASFTPTPIPDLASNYMGTIWESLPMEGMSTPSGPITVPEPL